MERDNTVQKLRFLIAVFPWLRIILCRGVHIPIPMAARSLAWVCGRSLAGFAGLNSAACVVVCLL